MTRILLIEDDEGFAEILKESLEDDGDMEIAKVIGSESEAMEFFKSGGLQDIQCILLDLQLPNVPHASHADSRAGRFFAVRDRSVTLRRGSGGSVPRCPHRPARHRQRRPGAGRPAPSRTGQHLRGG